VAKVKFFIEQSWLLIVSAIGFGLLLALTSTALGPRIEQNRIDKLNHLAGGLLPQAEHFVPLEPAVEIRSPQGKPQQVEAYKAVQGDQVVGWTFILIGSGFADKIALVVAVDRDFTKLAGYDVLSSNETPGFGDKIKYDYYRHQFVGAPAVGLKLVSTGDDKAIDEAIVAISGATVSSEAVFRTIDNAMTQIREALIERGLVPKAESGHDGAAPNAAGQAKPDGTEALLSESLEMLRQTLEGQD